MKRIIFICITALYILISCNDKKEVNAISSPNSVFSVRIGNNWGLVDTSCGFVLKPEFQYIGEFSDGFALIVRNQRYAYVNNTGKICVPFVYFAATDFSEGKAIVLDSLNRIHCIDTSFKVLFSLPDSVDETGVFSEGLLPVMCKGKYGYYNNKGNLVIPYMYDLAGNFKEQVAPVGMMQSIKDSVFSQWYFIDKSGRKIIDSVFHDAFSFHNGLAAVHLNSGDWGWINKSGKFPFGKQFQECKSFSEGFAAFKSGDLWGLMNNKGKTIVAPSYSGITDMNDGLSVISLGPQHCGYIDSAGKIFLNPDFKAASKFTNHFSYVLKDNRVSILSRSGRLICEEQFDGVPNFLGVELGFLESSMNLHLVKIKGDSLAVVPNP